MIQFLDKFFGLGSSGEFSIGCAGLSVVLLILGIGLVCFAVRRR